jgi:DNA-binding transcriptional ArsR family regulator
MPGDADIAATGALLGDRGRARMVMALADGRALCASVLAREAGVAASTASGHLSRLLAGGLVVAEPHGRYRYFRLAGPEVARMIEAMALVSPPAPVASLREGTRASALRAGRTCYDHLAGRLGTGLMSALIDAGVIAGGDGAYDPAVACRDRPSARGYDVDYRLTERGAETLTAFGVDIRAAASGRRPLVGYCVDWSEQRHHLAGALGAAIHRRLLERGWISPAPPGRAVSLTPAGAAGLRAAFGFVAVTRVGDNLAVEGAKRDLRPRGVVQSRRGPEHAARVV